MQAMRALSLAALAALVAGACVGPDGTSSWSSNQRSAHAVVPAFNALVSRAFVGQARAVSAVRAELQDFVELDRAGGLAGPLLLHFVGPKGTGKSLLASLVARAQFDDCDGTAARAQGMVRRVASWLASSLASWLPRLPEQLAPLSPVRAVSALGGALDGVLERSCDAQAPGDGRLREWWMACGVVYQQMVHIDDVTVLDAFLRDAARELQRYPRAVLVLDDFNLCGRTCAQRLKEAVQERFLRTADGVQVSASRATIIFCSDLTDIGLALERSETYDNALAKVRDAAEQHWGKAAGLLALSTLIPFAPMSDMEVLHVISHTLAEVEHIVKMRVARSLAERASSSAEGRPLRWDGSFVCEESTKLEVLDRLHAQISRNNLRAITTEFRLALFHAVRNGPHGPVEKRLSLFRSGAEYDFCRQDIVVKVKGDIDLVIDLVIRD
jgi:hypothetical protein